MQGAGLVAASSLVPGLARAADFATPIKEPDAIFGFGHVGPISDEGWTSSHHQGMLAVKAAFSKAKYIEIENIPYPADATRVPG